MQPRCSILIRTCRRDTAWLPYLFQSIFRFTEHFETELVVAPQEDAFIIEEQCFRFGFNFQACENDTCNGYLAQQITKLKADEFLGRADFVLHIDSDCAFILPSQPSDFIRDGKPIIIHRDYKWFPDREGSPRMWKEPTERAMGFPVSQEFMRRQPHVFPRWLYGKLRDHLTRTKGMPWDEWIAGQPMFNGFSEFNCLGALAWEKFHDKFLWINENDVNSLGIKSKHLPVMPRVLQYWSLEGLPLEVEQELIRILNR